MRALKLTSDEVVVIEVGPVRMATIKRTNNGEKNVMISETEFRGNINYKKSKWYCRHFRSNPGIKQVLLDFDGSSQRHLGLNSIIVLYQQVQ